MRIETPTENSSNGRLHNRNHLHRILSRAADPVPRVVPTAHALKAHHHCMDHQGEKKLGQADG